ADVVVARDVRVEASSVAGAVYFAVLENCGYDGLEHALERDGLGVVGIEREPNATHGLEHVVADRPDRGRVTVGAELAAGAHRPLFDAARYAGVCIHDAAVRVLAEAEAERHYAVARRGHRADFLGPRSIRLPDRRERV